MYESLLLITGQRDSWFYDSPLNDLGLRQCDELHKALKAVGGSGDKTGDMEYQQSVATLRGEPGSQPSIVVSSNLRRAISTVAVALRDRFGARPAENVKILTCLQEISRNPDTLSLTPARAQPVPSWIERGKGSLDSLDFASFYAQRLDVSQYDGNKALSSTGGDRLLGFAEWCFNADNCPVGSAVIIGGHSLWFRTFFRAFLPRASKHVSKAKKIVNGGCVSLEILKVPLAAGGFGYTVAPESVATVYGGFAK